MTHLKQGHNMVAVFFVEKGAVPQLLNKQKVAVKSQPISAKVAVKFRLILSNLLKPKSYGELRLNLAVASSVL